jgi:hypothetical protein
MPAVNYSGHLCYTMINWYIYNDEKGLNVFCFYHLQLIRDSQRYIIVINLHDDISFDQSEAVI